MVVLDTTIHAVRPAGCAGTADMVGSNPRLSGWPDGARVSSWSCLTRPSTRFDWALLWEQSAIQALPDVAAPRGWSGQADHDGNALITFIKMNRTAWFKLDHDDVDTMGRRTSDMIDEIVHQIAPQEARKIA